MPNSGSALSIVERLLVSRNLRNARAYVYGSSVRSEDFGRDLDLLLVSPDLDGCPELYSLTLGRPANVYLVPQQAFVEDAEDLAAGGFYAHKFLFGFRELKSIGTCVDVAALFWKRTISPSVPVTRSPEQLVHLAQRYALSCRPTLARSLAKFLTDDNRTARLLAFVSAVVRETPVETVPVKWRQHPRCAAAAFHLFWCEYARHKAGGNLLAPTVRQKMHTSMSYLTAPAVEDFVNRPTDDIS